MARNTTTAMTATTTKFMQRPPAPPPGRAEVDRWLRSTDRDHTHIAEVRHVLQPTEADAPE